MISDGGWERQRRGAVTNEHPRRGVRQTNSERKGRLNVLGMLPTGLEGALTPSPRATPRASRCLAPPPPSLRRRMSCLREGNQFGPGGEVPHEGTEQRGSRICWLSSQNRASVIS